MVLWYTSYTCVRARARARAPGNPRQVFPRRNRSMKKLLDFEFTQGQASVGWGPVVVLWKSAGGPKVVL